MDVLIDRCGGLDVHKKQVTACTRVPGGPGQRHQVVRTFPTFAADLAQLREWLAAQGVTTVAMEATGVYWKPVYYELEGHFELLLVNARAIKQAPGRKSDVIDAAWIAQLAECGLLRASFVPPPPVRRLRDLTRYRKRLIEDRSREVQRIQKVLEDAGVKLSSVASDVVGVSGRAMLEALVAGQRDPEVLAELARGRLRAKRGELRSALAGHFSAHHGAMVTQVLAHVGQLEEAIARLDCQVDREMAPYAEHASRLCTIPGVGKRLAEVIVAEIGIDMGRFPDAGHLASWAGMCPNNNQSAGKRGSGRTRKGSRWLRTALVEAAWAAAHTHDTYLSAQFWRIARRRGQTKAAVAVGHSILVAAYHILASGQDYIDLGGDYFVRRQGRELYQRRLVDQLERLGFEVQLTATTAS